MTPTEFGLAVLLLILLLGLVAFYTALYTVMREQAAAIRDLRQERDLAQAEVRALTDAIARSNGIHVERETPEAHRRLEPSDGYWDGPTEVRVKPEA